MFKQPARRPQAAEEPVSMKDTELETKEVGADILVEGEPVGAERRRVGRMLKANATANLPGPPDSPLEIIEQTSRDIKAAMQNMLEEMRRIDSALQSLKAEDVRPRLGTHALLFAGRGSLPRMSRMQRAVLGELTRGKSNREISDELGVCEKTVKNHLWHIYRKLGVKSRAQLLCRFLSP
jgi:DNA-binding NarL/FixJ family response regulator